MAVSHDQTFLEAIGVERGDHSLAKHSAVKVSFGSMNEPAHAGGAGGAVKRLRLPQ